MEIIVSCCPVEDEADFQLVILVLIWIILGRAVIVSNQQPYFPVETFANSFGAKK